MRCRYLSPACTGSVIAVAALKGQLSRFWTWNDGDDLSGSSKFSDKTTPDFPTGDLSSTPSRTIRTGLADGDEIPNPFLKPAVTRADDTEGDESEAGVRRSPRKRAKSAKAVAA